MQQKHGKKTNDRFKKKFGMLLYNRRMALKVSRKKLANTVGISPKTIQSWEMGRTFPEDMLTMKRVCRTLTLDAPKMFEEAWSAVA